MRKKRFITLGLIVAAFGVAGIVAFMKYQDERITYKPNLTSMLEDRSDCDLCGNNSKSLRGYYRNFEDLLLVYLPTWDIWPAHIFDENIEIEGSNTIMGTSRDGMYRYSTDVMKSRGISEISIQITEKENPIWNVETLETMLCSQCLSKVTDTLEITSARKDCFPEPFCLVNASSLEVYSLQKKDRVKVIDDYYVSINFDADEKSVLAVYAPDNRMASLMSIQ